MKIRVLASSALAGALALTGVLAIQGSAQAASVAINLNVYDSAAVDSTISQCVRPCSGRALID